MKRLLTLSAVLMSMAGAFAQDAYTVKMSMKIEGLPPEYAGFGDNDIVSYYKGENYKQEMTGMMGSNTTFFDGKKLIALSDQMGNKMGYTVTKEEMDKANAKEKGGEKPKVEYTTEKKIIAGYECTKAIVTNVDKDKKERKIVAWVTDKLKTPDSHTKGAGRRGAGMDLGDLKGYPLGIEADQSQGGMNMKFVMTATEVSTGAIDDSIFKANTDGYTIMTYKEYMDKMKSMGGGN